VSGKARKRLDDSRNSGQIHPRRGHHLTRAAFGHGMGLGTTGVPTLVTGDRLVMGNVPEAEIKELLR